MESNNLWAPWRIKYIQGLAANHDCFICHNIGHPEHDTPNIVLWRTRHCIVILNRFPYNNGHLLIAPLRHVGELEEITDDEMAEMMTLIRQTKKALTLAMKPHGFNIGINLGKCAGAGLPGHLHIHVVPRWDGDTNFMPVCAGIDVISQSLAELLELLRKVSAENNLPDMNHD